MISRIYGYFEVGLYHQRSLFCLYLELHDLFYWSRVLFHKDFQSVIFLAMFPLFFCVCVNLWLTESPTWRRNHRFCLISPRWLQPSQNLWPTKLLKRKSLLLSVSQLMPKRWRWDSANPSSVSFPSRAFCSVIVYICLFPKKVVAGGVKKKKNSPPKKRLESPLAPGSFGSG